MSPRLPDRPHCASAIERREQAAGLTALDPDFVRASRAHACRALA
jgi:hypothetical protein